MGTQAPMRPLDCSTGLATFLGPMLDDNGERSGDMSMEGPPNSHTQPVTPRAGGLSVPAGNTTDQLSVEVQRLAREVGFERVGIADASEPLDSDFSHYEAFVTAGMHGEMAYLSNNREVRRRLDAAGILDGAKSVVCVAERYAPTTSDSGTGCRTELVGNLARYARGRDYHDHLRKRLRALASSIRALVPGTDARPMTDTAPVLERAWAVRAGLGFVGKNGLLIVPGAGSYVLLGEVVTTIALKPSSARPAVDVNERCGSCRLCLDACPSEAFDAPFVLDPRRCVAYLTIELRGAMPEALRDRVGEHLFGCDACQEVCPYNRARRLPAAADYEPLPQWQQTSLEALAELDASAMVALLRGSSLRRAGRAGLVRNAITVLGNRRDPALRGLFERVAFSDTEASVREHARWAIAQLEDGIANAAAPPPTGGVGP